MPIHKEHLGSQIRARMHTEDVTNQKVIFADRYEIVCLLGRGGMGDVYLAKDQLIDNSLIALKILHNNSEKYSVFVERFTREIQVTRMLSHKNIIRTYELGTFGNKLYYTMEFIEGPTLEDELDNYKLTQQEAINIFYQLCLGPKEIHNAGIIHRDIKSANIIIGKDGIPKYGDFGTAHLKDSNLTLTHDVIGTYEYVAPEVFITPEVTTAADIYSLGVIAYKMFTGTTPFLFENHFQLIYSKSQGQIEEPKIREREISEKINNLILSMLKKDPQERICLDNAIIELELYISQEYKTNPKDIIKPYEVKTKINTLDKFILPNLILNNTSQTRLNSYINSNLSESFVNLISTVKLFELNTKNNKKYKIIKYGTLISLTIILSWYVFISKSFKERLYSPAGVTGLVAWYNCNNLNLNNGDKVSTLSNNALDKKIIAFQNDSENQPKFYKRRAFGYPVIEFDGDNDFLEANEIATSLRESETSTLVYVARSYEKDVQHYLLTAHLEDKESNLFHAGFIGDNRVRIRTIKDPFPAGFHDSSPVIINGFSVYVVTFEKRSVSVFQNGKKLFEDKITDPIEYSRAKYFSIGQEYDDKKPADFFKGELAEVLIYDRSLNSKERHKIESLLADKYLLSLRVE